jgi:hypothetical protein
MKRFKLKLPAVFVLFLTSYIPLFGLLVLRQMKQNKEYLFFGGFDKVNILCFIEKFGLSCFFIGLIIIGMVGVRIFLKNLNANHSNGYLVKIKDIENKNSESIAYISTYIIPFLFQDTSDTFDLLSIFLILALIFLIYSKSNMIVINPILNLKYSIYQISYSRNSIMKKGFLISPTIDIEENQEIKINLISKDIYYGY